MPYNPEAPTGAMTIRQFRETYGPARSTVYKLLGEGKLTAVKVGKAIYITRASAAAWFASLPIAAINQTIAFALRSTLASRLAHAPGDVEPAGRKPGRPRKVA